MTRVFGQLAAGTNNQNIINLLANKAIVVHALFIIAGGTAVAVTFKSKKVNGASTAISPAISLGANGQATLPTVDKGWFETAPGEQLDADVGAGSAVQYILFYSARG